MVALAVVLFVVAVLVVSLMVGRGKKYENWRNKE